MFRSEEEVLGVRWSRPPESHCDPYFQSNEDGFLNVSFSYGFKLFYGIAAPRFQELDRIRPRQHGNGMNFRAQGANCFRIARRHEEAAVAAPDTKWLSMPLVQDIIDYQQACPLLEQFPQIIFEGVFSGGVFRDGASELANPFPQPGGDVRFLAEGCTEDAVGKGRLYAFVVAESTGEHTLKYPSKSFTTF